MTLTEMKILPAPQRVTAGTEVLRIKRAMTVRSVDALPWGVSGMHGRLEAALKSAGLKVKFFEVDQYEEQAYKLEIGRGGVIVCARNARGLAYGAETLRQILSQSGTEIPCGVIEDAPRQHWRGVLLDMRVHKYTLAYLKALCIELARLKYSALVLNYHDMVAYKKEPCLRGAVYMTTEQLAELNTAASEAGIELIPYVSVLGSVDHIVELEQYYGLRTADGMLDVRQARSSKVMCTLLDEIIAAHDAPMVALGWPAPLAVPPDLDEATVAYLDALVAHVVKRNKSPFVCVGAGERITPWLAQAPKNVIIAHTAADAGGLQRLAGACAQNDVRMVGMTSGRAPQDSEWRNDAAAAIQHMHRDVSAIVHAGITRTLVVLPSGCMATLPLRPAPSALCGTRMMHANMSMPVLAAAADALWSGALDAERVAAAWPLWWWGVDDAHYNALTVMCQLDPLRAPHIADVVKQCKRALKLMAELKPARHVEDMALYELYARLAMHAVHVRQTFSRAPRGQQVTLLLNELSRLKDKHKAALSATLSRPEIIEEQVHLFGHTEMLAARMKGA